MEKENNLQVENGNFTRIHNRILEELAKIQLSGHEIRIIFALWRKTYGWQKKEEWITSHQFQQLTGLGKTRISESIKKLKKKNLVTEKRNSNRVKYGFNKHFTTWKKLQKNVTVTENRKRSYGKPEEELRKTVTENRRNNDEKRSLQTPKETITKETITKEIHTTKCGFADSKFCELNPEQQRKALDLVVQNHFKKFPYKDSPDSKIRSKNGWIGFRARTRDYYGGILQKYPTLKPQQIIKAIGESKKRQPWFCYPEERARMETQQIKPFQDNRKLLKQAKMELEQSSSEEKIYNWLCRLPERLHGALAKHLSRCYPKGHSYDKAKIKWEKRHKEEIT